MNARGLLKGIVGTILGLGMALSAWSAPAVVDKGEIVYDFGEQDYSWPCLDELVDVYNSVSAKYHWVQTPSGKTLYLEMWVKNVTGTMVGETSGFIWHRVGNVSPFIEHDNADGTPRIVHFTFKGAWVSENGGPTIEVHEEYHLCFDANGDLRVERDQVHCWESD